MASPAMTLQLTRLDDDRVQVLTLKSPKGEPEAEVRLPFNRAQRGALTQLLEAQSFKPSDWNTSEGGQQLAVLQQLGLADMNGFAQDRLVRIGSTLFNAFFPQGPLREALHATLDAETGANSPTRIELRLNANATDLGRFPWELLYDDERQSFLFSNRTSGIVRYIAHTKPVPSLLTEERLRVLFVAARPVDPLQVKALPDQEKAAIAQGLAEAKAEAQIALDELPPATHLHSTYDLIHHALNPGEPELQGHVLHFDGHGGYGIRCGRCGFLNAPGRAVCGQRGCEAPLGNAAQGYLAFEQVDQSVQWVSATEFANLLAGTGIRLVVLTACKSAVAAGESVFSGVAPALIGVGIPAVTAMQYSVSVPAASRFAQVFYRSLGQRNSLIAAMGQVRAALFTPYPESWYRPVLYLRVNEANPEGQLFASQKKLTPNKGKSKKDGASTSQPGVTFGNNAVVYGEVAGGNILHSHTESKPGSTADYSYTPTGDYQIDQVQETLKRQSAFGNISLEELFSQLSLLFHRAAFEEHVCRQDDQSTKLLLHAVTATELVLRPWRALISRQGRRNDLPLFDALRSELMAMRDLLARMFGGAFSLAAHINHYGLGKDTFVSALPERLNAELCEQAEPHRQEVLSLAHQLFDQ